MAMNIILLLVQVKTLLSSVAFPQRKSLHPDWDRHDVLACGITWLRGSFDL
jgi:hypothetical protein